MEIFILGVCVGGIAVCILLAITPKAKAPKPRIITEAEMAAGDLYSAATCGLSTLRGLDVTIGGRVQFIEGMLKKHAKYAPNLA